MAILPRYPGFEVTVEVGDNPLPEYDFVEAHVGENALIDAATARADPIPGEDADVAPAPTSSEVTKVAKYIASPLSGEFTIRYKCKSDFGYASDLVYLEPSLDGKVIFIPNLRYSLKDGYDSQVCHGGEVWQGDAMRAHRFSFTELNIGTFPPCSWKARLITPSVEENIPNGMRRQKRDQGEIRLDFYFMEKGQTVAATDLPQMQFDDNSK
jgi:hypothetical protein